MSVKHNTKHIERSKSNYPARLTARGLAKAPEMESLETLRKRQQRRVEETCTLSGEHGHHDPCNGVPWFIPSTTADETEAA